MTVRRCIVALGLAAAALLPLRTVSATVSAAAADPCSIALPPNVFAVAGLPSGYGRLTGGGALLDLTLFPGHGLNAQVTLAGGPKKLPSNDRVADFDFTAPHHGHLYAGPVHVFKHGSTQHVCRSGDVLVDKNGDTSQSGNNHKIPLRIDGTIANKIARLTVWVAGSSYSVVGRIRKP